MEVLHIIPDLEKKGFRDGVYTVVEHKGPLIVGGMEHGTEGAKPVVMIGFDMGEGKEVLVAQTTLALFLSAADALRIWYQPRHILPGGG